MSGLVDALVADGHELVVVTSQPPSGSPALADGVTYLMTTPADRVLWLKRRTGWLRRVVQRHRTVQNLADRDVADRDGHAPTGELRAGSILVPFERTRRWVRSWVSFPDTMWSWGGVARRALRQSGFEPDVIIASAPPMAALVAAAGAARRLEVPWIADMRDLWTGDPYRRVPRSARRLDRFLERRTLRSAAAVTTVAEPLERALREVAPAIPIYTMRNGFAASWLRCGDEPPQLPAEIVYTGTLTANTGRDLTAVCAAMNLLVERHGDRAPRLRLFGAIDRQLIEALRATISPSVIDIAGEVTADEAREAQHNASVLLNFAWEDPRDFGKCPAKLFEYAAARRPVLHIGRVETLGVALIREFGLGRVVDPHDPAAVAESIDELIAGGWTPPAPSELAALSQDAMIEEFRRAIRGVIGPSGVGQSPA
jgi:hypothetical protein